MIKNKHIVQFVAVLLCTTLLTFSASRVTRVKAVVTEAAVIGGVALIVGTAFLGYLALTGAYVQYTDIDTRNDYVTDVGKWVIENCNGIGISKLIAQASDWVGRQALSAGSFVVEYTSDLISDFYNSFNNTQVIQNAISINVPPNILRPTLNYTYNTPRYTFNQNKIIDQVNGVQYIYEIQPGYYYYLIAEVSNNSTEVPDCFLPFQIAYDNLVNYQISGNSYYRVGQIQGNTITPIDSIRLVSPFVGYQQGVFVGFSKYAYSTQDREYFINGNIGTATESYGRLISTALLPLIANAPLYLTDSRYNIINKTADLANTTSTSVSFPNQDDDSDIYPIIPFVPFPNSPNNPNGFWGTFVDDILDGILDGLETALIAALIDEFTNDNGGDSIMYDDDVTNYYYYYDIKNDITQQSEELPIDLNEIALYTDNTYLTTLKDSVESLSDVIHDYVGFWYDVDPTVVIVILGSAVLSVVTLLLHKMGG